MTDTALPPEPDDRTALYWPETETTFATILVRDDSTATACGYPPEQRWWEANADNPPDTWATVCAKPFMRSLGDPIVLAAAPVTPEDPR